MKIKTFGDLKKFVENASDCLPDDIPILAQSSVGMPNGTVGYTKKVDITYLNMENYDGTVGTVMMSVCDNGKGE